MSPPSSTPPPSIESLRARWTELYAQTLPILALSKVNSQPSWPVHLDHCFARIILDAIIGIDTPWTAKLKGPAVKNMNAEQLQQCIELGTRIACGEENLAEFDERSLKLRGKVKGGKRKRVDGTEEREDGDGDGDGKGKKSVKAERDETPRKKQLDIRSSLGLPTPPSSKDELLSEPPSPAPIDSDLTSLIKSSKLTPFRQRTLLALCQVPAGQYTTYAALSEFLGSCPRAVGNAMRNNPFAPRVPCHRVVASDGGIGGFGGEWGDMGGHVGEKVGLLRGEGVKVVEERRGGGMVLRVKGRVWRGFR